jgi:ESCRT-II complex subunit VPS25
MAASSYSFPDFWHFPPMFTIQKVDKTRESQFQMWTDLLTGYLESQSKTSIYVDKEAGAPPFTNPEIRKSLHPDGIRQVLDYMSSQGFGSWSDDEKTIFSCSWRKLSDWANSIYKWAVSMDQIGKINTIYDLHSGDETDGEDFHGIEPGLLLKALDVLEEEGKVRVYKDGDQVDEFGVKFYEA